MKLIEFMEKHPQESVASRNGVESESTKELYVLSAVGLYITGNPIKNALNVPVAITGKV